MRLLNICLLAFLQVINGLQTVPVPDDLLGPGQCPTGSFCIETNNCNQEYYTTKSGLPFYCGPHHEIDTKICCVSTDHEASQQHYQYVGMSMPQQFDEQTEAIQRFHRSNFNGTLNNENDDEVDILSMPFTQDVAGLEEEPFDAPLHNPDLEFILEKAIDKEMLNFDKSPNQGESKVSDEQNFGKNFENLINLDQDSADPSESTSGHGQEVVVEGRTQTQGQLFPRATCACEKGEKGDRGEPGPAGEPGKIIYIPVFANNPSSFQPPIFEPGNQHEQYRPVWENIPPPSHPNPTVIPYNVHSPLTPEAPRPVPPSPQPQTQLNHHFGQPQNAKVPIPQPPSPSQHPSSFAMAADMLQDRLTRSQKIGSKRVKRFQRAYD